MPVTTRSGSDDKELSQKLDRILDVVSQLNSRVSALEDSVQNQKDAIKAISNENLLKNTDIGDACGVDPSQIQRNQLMGESSKRKQEDQAVIEKRKQKQKLGARLYAAYFWVFMALMAASFMGVLPVFEFEKSFNEEDLTNTSVFLKSTLHIPVLISGLYVLVIFGIQKVMEDRERFDLRYPLAAWSLFLGMFSLIGSIRTVPVLIKMMQEKGVKEVICGDTRRDWLFSDPAGFWAFIFVLSKVPELIDTLFIVLRKNKLITLHWYHHITVMLFCWHSWGTHSLYGIFFAAMNLTVHAFMYVFYFLAAMGYRPTAFAQSVTILQIVQMLFGTMITFYVAFHMTFVVQQDLVGSALSPNSLDWNLNVSKFIDDSPKCKVNPGNALAGIMMYTSYLWLFCVFFYYAYIHIPPKPVAVEKKNN